jgi:hypothetical protein
MRATITVDRPNGGEAMSARVLAKAVVVFAATGFAPAAVWAQAPARATQAIEDPSFKLPRTSWGDPDLQGVWDYRTITPLERRPELGDREFYTDEEIAQLEGRAARRMDKPPDESTPANLVHAEYLTDPGRRLDSRRTSLIVDPPNGRMPPLTDAAQERQARARAAGAPAGRPGGRADSYRDRTLLERCISRGVPGAILPGLYNNNIRITQSPGFVAIVHEMVHETRVVPLDGGAFSAMRGYMGESHGRWEGDTLVVETRNFNGKVVFRGAGENLRLVERYKRVGPETIDFQLTFDDPTQWTQPWTVAYSMRPAEGELYEYACHEGNYGLRNILENARDEEKAAAAAAKK